MHPELIDLARKELAISHREHPELSGAIYYARRTGELLNVLPGVFVPSEYFKDWRALAAAACKFSPDVVITGAAALDLTIRTNLEPGFVEAYNTHRIRSAPIHWHQRIVPPSWRTQVGPLQVAAPAWAAVDMCADGDATPLDWCLNKGVRLSTLWEAFADMPNRSGNKVRRQLLLDSRDEPWSPAERLGHRVLRDGGIKGWRTNQKIAGHCVDISFDKGKLVLEIDGFRYHSSHTSFEEDRRRDQDLLAAGWAVMRITWNQLETEPDRVIAQLKAILRRRRGL